MGDFTPLIGTDEATLDDKGRVTFTVKKVQRLGERSTMTRGEGDCLVIYPDLVWRSLVSEVLAMPVMHPDRMSFTRLVLGPASDAYTFDQQNRIVVPADLREAVNLKPGTKLKIVGCGDRVEIWPASKWEQMEKGADEPSRDQNVASAYAPIASEFLNSKRTDQETAKESGA